MIMGRKPLNETAKGRVIMVRVTESEHAEIETAAAGQPTSTWVRDLALAAARATPAKRTRKPAK